MCSRCAECCCGALVLILVVVVMHGRWYVVVAVHKWLSRFFDLGSGGDGYGAWAMVVQCLRYMGKDCAVVVVHRSCCGCDAWTIDGRWVEVVMVVVDGWWIFGRPGRVVGGWVVFYDGDLAVDM